MVRKGNARRQLFFGTIKKLDSFHLIQRVGKEINGELLAKVVSCNFCPNVSLLRARRMSKPLSTLGITAMSATCHRRRRKPAKRSMYVRIACAKILIFLHTVFNILITRRYFGAKRANMLPTYIRYMYHRQHDEEARRSLCWMMRS